MVRLMLVLAPVMCILSGIAVSSLLTTYMKDIDPSKTDKKSKKTDSSFALRSKVSYEAVKLFIGVHTVAGMLVLFEVCTVQGVHYYPLRSI